MSAYIRLITPTQLSKDQIRQWFGIIEKYLPTGMIASTTIVVDDKEKSTKFYAKKLDDKFSYIVPLVRDLASNEIHDLVQRWNTAYPEGDYIIDYSQNDVHYPTYSTNSIEQRKIEQVLDSWAKKEHKRWMQNAIDHGWKYGTTMSTKSKTHPWLQPWEQLPAIAQQQKLSGVKDLLSALNDFGYTIIQRPIG